MMPRALAAALGLALTASVWAAGCFDVEKFPLPPLVIDDFEDGDDLRPKTDELGDWTCRGFTSPATDAGASGDAGEVSCVVEAVGLEHQRAMTMRFEVVDPPDGTKQFGRAVLATEIVPGGNIDFTRFKELVLSATLELGDPPLPAATQLAIEIGCTLAGEPFTVEKVVGPLVIGSDWTTFRLALADFAPAEPGCLREPRAFRISVRPSLLDGDSARSALHVDNIFLH